MVHVTRRDLGDQDGHANNGMSLKCSSRGITSLSDDVFQESLKRIDLSKNEIKSIPSGISVCLNVTWLNLSGNALTDCKPLESLRNLEVLNLSKNKLYGKIGVGKFTKLKTLVLNGNEIETLGGLEKLTHIETLIISQNKISSFGGWIAGATSLQKLSASNNPIEWDLGGNSGLSSLSAMKELRMNHTGMQRVPQALASMKRLRILELGSNHLETFEDISVLSSMRSIWQLNLKGNPIASVSGYGEKITSLLPQIDVLDTKRLRSKHKHLDVSSGEKKQKEEPKSSQKRDVENTFKPTPPASPAPSQAEDDALEPEDFLVTTREENKMEEKQVEKKKKKQQNEKKTNKGKKKKHVSKDALQKALQAKETSLSTWD